MIRCGVPLAWLLALPLAACSLDMPFTTAPASPSTSPLVQAAIDPDFALLAQTLPSRTDIPVWLPSEAPRSPASGLCPHYVLYTHPPGNADSNKYSIVMYCSAKQYSPDDPTLDPHPAQVGLLGSLDGSKLRPQIGMPFKDPRWRVAEEIQLTDAILGQRYTYGNGPVQDAIGWTVGPWQYAAWTNRIGSGDSAALAKELAALAAGGPPVASAARGWVTFEEDNHNFMTIAWQEPDASYYELDWSRDMASAFALTRSLVQVSGSHRKP